MPAQDREIVTIQEARNLLLQRQISADTYSQIVAQNHAGDRRLDTPKYLELSDLE